MIEVIYRIYQYDFRDDLELRISLARHLVPLNVRLEWDLRIQNPLLDEIKSGCSLAYFMAVSASMVLAEKHNKRLSEDEIGYIALSFALAISRKRNSMNKKNILIVTQTGINTAKFLKEQIATQFKSSINKICTVDVSDIGDTDFSDIDFVFTMTDEPLDLNIPQRHVGLLLGKSDIEDAKKSFDAQDGGFDSAKYFSENLFFPSLKIGNKLDAIKYLCQVSMTTYSLPNNFIDSVIDRERMALTAFGGMIAVPHPKEPIGVDTFATVGILNEPIEWDNQLVQLVILFSCSVESDKDAQEITSLLANLALNEEAVDEIILNRTYKTLMDKVYESSLEENLGEI